LILVITSLPECASSRLKFSKQIKQTKLESWVKCGIRIARDGYSPFPYPQKMSFYFLYSQKRHQLFITQFLFQYLLLKILMNQLFLLYEKMRLGRVVVVNRW